MPRSSATDETTPGKAPERSPMRVTRRAAIVAAVSASTLLAGIAVAAPKLAKLPAPVITSHPASATNRTSAHLSYSDRQSGVGYSCQIDNGPYVSCPRSGITYRAPLREGKHTFHVRARSGSKTSSSASFTWVVDTSSPTTSLSYPGNGAALSAGAWGNGCPAGAGLCGSAADKYGIASVAVSIRGADGRWWNGSGYEAATETFLAAEASAAGTGATWRYRLPLPPAGSYVVRVRASDRAGNVTSAAAQGSGSFTIASPAQPSSPSGPSSPAPAPETVVEGKPFTVSGGTAEALAPGLARQLALTIANPNKEAITVTSLEVKVAAGSSKAGCDGPANLAVTQSNISEANPLVVPANGHATLPGGGVTAPQVLMRDLSTNQDACKGASFTFDYSGSAHS
jgi:hypothetical protein